ncbi:MAG TPA: glycerophosphodiester phosphodiesterase [Pseudonocardiaceae bacterium]
MPVPAISAHRGGRERAPAGTWAAFTTALESRPEYVEFDVRRTADGAWVVRHDEHVAGRAVGSLTYAELSRLAGHEVPLAMEVMELIAGRAYGHIDLKEDDDELAVAGPAVDLLGVDGFVATTENPASIRRIRSALPGVRTALSTAHPVRGARARAGRRARNRPLDLREVIGCGASGVALHHRAATPEVLRRCRRGGVEVMVWTVNAPRRVAHFLAEPRVDVLITDRPFYASRLRERLGSGPGA